MEKEMQLMTVTEVAEMLRVKKPTIYKLVRDGELKAIKFSGETNKRIRFLKEDILDFIFPDEK